VRAVCQRVSRARVVVDGAVVGAIGLGWVLLVGVGPADGEREAAWLVDRIAGLRAFEDRAGRMNLAAADVEAQFLVVSQFTLYADLSRGRRPGFSGAAPPSLAELLVERVVALLRGRGFEVATGRFGAAMDVELVNQGPVTIVLSTDGWDGQPRGSTS
jgi:D-tyrosyl-tRNA(Tyr) deacylase